MNRIEPEPSVDSSAVTWNNNDAESSSSSSSFDDDHSQHESSSFRRRGMSFSEHHQQQIELEYVESVHVGRQSATAPSNNTNNTGSVSTEQERQILLLMLLAQVCALHDPTPRTFTVHVLELFERGILDRQSIHFLFELGLVPSLNTASKLLTAGTAATNPPEATTTTAASAGQLIANPSMGARNRSMQVSAIRSTLEQLETSVSQELSPTKANATTTAHAASASWSAEHHPLSLSRYQREFDQVALLSSGSFGQVFQAVNKTDGQSYAVKRVPFHATGYSKDSVQQVTREVQCLAVCDHPNVVRYYTSWLEPSWMTGSGGKASVVIPNQNKLLTNGSSSGERRRGGGDEQEESDDLMGYYFRDPQLFSKSSSPHRTRRSFSLDNSDPSASWRPASNGESSDDESEEQDDHVGGDCHSDDESDIFDRSRPAEQENGTRDDSYLDDLLGRGRLKKKKDKQQPTYRYQICLFIQMQLCHPNTLADWIRARNRQMEDSTLAERLQPALQIFDQICSGLAHVHNKHIVHRDLKPANIFAAQDGSSFLIGDFGLSKLLQQQQQPSKTTAHPKKEERLLLMYQSPRNGEEDWKEAVNEPSWVDPLTAGVGTASYASPEQVASAKYGKEADIFSAGLILLELLCCFCTEHERLQTFHDFRYRRDLPDDIKKIPNLAQIILQCTEKQPEKRPTAESLRQFALMALSYDDSESMGATRDEEDKEEDESEMEMMKRQLAEKQNEVDNLKSLLSEKDKTIAALEVQVSSLRVTAIQNKTRPFQSSVILRPPVDDCFGANDSGSSSEDEM